MERHLLSGNNQSELMQAGHAFVAAGTAMYAQGRRVVQKLDRIIDLLRLIHDVAPQVRKPDDTLFVPKDGKP